MNDDSYPCYCFCFECICPKKQNEFYFHSIDGEEKNTLPPGVWDLFFEELDSKNSFVIRYVLSKKTDMTEYLKNGKLIKFSQIR